MSHNVAFELGLELGVRTGGSVRSLVPKSSWSWAEPELGQYGTRAEPEVERCIWTKIQDSGIVKDAPELQVHKHKI